MVRSLIDKGHQVALFNRGKTNPHLFPKIHKIRGDREKGRIGYQNLEEDKNYWDVVIDVWPENPHYVEEAIQILKDRKFN